MDNRQIVFEVCCGSLQSALNAQEGGAGRLKTEINVLIRPRGGDFLYEPEEVAVMISDIQARRYKR